MFVYSGKEMILVESRERQRRIRELSEKSKRRALERGIERVKAEMSGEIADFSRKYSFADSTASEKLKKLIDELPCDSFGIDFDKFPAHRKFSSQSTDLRNRTAWFCSLVGGEEIFEIFVKGRVCDFLADYDDWYFYGAYMLLVDEDFGGLIYIDDNGGMTEAFLR